MEGLLKSDMVFLESDWLAVGQSHFTYIKDYRLRSAQGWNGLLLHYAYPTDEKSTVSIWKSGQDKPAMFTITLPGKVFPSLDSLTKLYEESELLFGRFSSVTVGV